MLRPKLHTDIAGLFIDSIYPPPPQKKKSFKKNIRSVITQSLGENHSSLMRPCFLYEQSLYKMRCEWHKLIGKILCPNTFVKVFVKAFNRNRGDKREGLCFRGSWYAEGVWVTPGTLHGSWNAVMRQNEWMRGVCRRGVFILRWLRVNSCLWVDVHSTA